MSTSRRTTGRLSVLATLLALGAAAVPGLAVQAAAALPTACAAMDTPVQQRHDASTRATVFTTSPAEAARFDAAGFTADDGTPFRAAAGTAVGLQPVHRLYRSATKDYLFTASPTELTSAQAKYGYSDQGVSFYASRTPASCLLPVYRYRDAGKHILVSTAAGRAALEDANATPEGIAFYAAPTRTPAVPPPTDSSTFTLAVVPPTQQEVTRPGDLRWARRTAWLAKNKDDLNLAFVADTGDVVNWGAADRQQFQRVQTALTTLSDAGIPYSLSLGNHDTAAVCAGGSACDPSRTTQLFRDTTAFNSYFDAAGFGAVGGEFEPGKVDNSYSQFTAGGRSWLVLSLEMWPRKAAVAWAQDVVAAHPQSNVIVSTHQYMTGDGEIDTSAGYGQSSGRYLYDNLISRYPNVKLVFSGHEGDFAYRTDSGVGGNKVYSIGVHMHNDTTNPIQLVSIDTEAGTLSTRVYGPDTDEDLPGFTRTINAITWI